MTKLITGQVVDSAGKPVGGASVYVVKAPVAMPDIAHLTGEDGCFALPAPSEGDYRIGISKDDAPAVELDVQVTEQAPGSLRVPIERT